MATQEINEPPHVEEGGEILTRKNNRLRRYLISRHGETNFNKERRVQGTLDESTLTYNGISQAAALGVFLSLRQSSAHANKGKFDHIIHFNMKNEDCNEEDKASSENSQLDKLPIIMTWCSPMQRCRQTYAAVSGCCKAYGCPLPEPTIHAELREIELREWQGRLRKDVATQDPENWSVFRSNPPKFRLKGGFAPLIDCWERGLRNWDIIRSKAKKDSVELGDGEVFIMCHGAIGQCMLLQALGLSDDMYGKVRRYAFDNCDCIEIEWADGEVTSRRWRRVHPKATKWQSTPSSQLASEGLMSGR